MSQSRSHCATIERKDRLTALENTVAKLTARIEELEAKLGEK